MSNLHFTDDMFDECKDDKAIADLCNAYFDDWLSRQIIVYGFAENEGRLLCGTENKIGDTFIGRLVNIRDLKPKPCLHLPTSTFNNDLNFSGYVCKHCGVKMKVTWEVEA